MQFCACMRNGHEFPVKACESMWKPENLRRLSHGMLHTAKLLPCGVHVMCGEFLHEEMFVVLSCSCHAAVMQAMQLLSSSVFHGLSGVPAAPEHKEARLRHLNRTSVAPVCIIYIHINRYIYITNVWCIATTTMSREQRRWKHGISWKFNRSLRNELKFNDFNGISTFFDISRCLCCQVFLNVDPIDPLRFQAAKLKQSKLCVGVSRFVEILRTPKKLYIIW